MFGSFIIRAGDVVVCVNDRPPVPMLAENKKVKDRVNKGAYYRVTAVVWLNGEKGLHLESKDHRPTAGWRASRFRKVQRSEPEFAERLETLRPVRQLVS